jgi:hypothetical protein
MRTEPFREFLTKRYRSRKTGRPLSARAAGDAVSRCLRVESVLGIDLESPRVARADVVSVLTTVEKRARDFRFSGGERRGLSQLRSALKLYLAFAKGTTETPKTRHFYPGRFP